MTTLQSTDVQLSLIDWLPQQDHRKRGESFVMVLDGERLDKSCHDLARILECWRDVCSPWYTLQELKDAGMTCMPQSISARLREVREWLTTTRCGQIQHRAKPNAPRGIFEYRYNPDPDSPKSL